MRLSPDEKHVALIGIGAGRKTPCLWLLNLASDAIGRLTPEARGVSLPAWTADSKSIAVHLSAVLSAVDSATGASQPLSTDPNVTYAYDWSPNGKHILATQGGGANPSMLSLEGDRKVSRLLNSRFAVRGFRFSPDSQWVAYFLNQDQVYLAPFPAINPKRQISVTGGRLPVWRADEGINQYSASADGSRFLVNEPVTDQPRAEIMVVLNWPAELKR